MADITDQHDQGSPSALDDHSGNNGSIEARGIKRQRPSTAEDADSDDDKPGRERRKIEIKFITDKSRRHITFSKRKAGIMKKVRSLKTIPSLRVDARILIDGVTVGIRALRLDGHPSPPPGRFGNGSCLHFHHPKATTSGDQGRGQEFDPGGCTLRVIA